MDAANSFRAAFGGMTLDEKESALEKAFHTALQRTCPYAQLDRPIEATEIASQEIAAYQWTASIGEVNLPVLYNALDEYDGETDLLGCLLMQLEAEGVTMTPATKTSLRRIGGSIVALATANTAPMQLSCYPEVVRKVIAFASANPATLYRAYESPWSWYSAHTTYLLDLCTKAGAPAVVVKDPLTNDDALRFEADGSTIGQRTLYSHLVQTRAHLICSAGRAIVASEPWAGVRAIELHGTLSQRNAMCMPTLDGKLFNTLAGLCTSTVAATLFMAISELSAYTVVVYSRVVVPVLYMRCE
jgi:hypothetical protein